MTPVKPHKPNKLDELRMQIGKAMPAQAPHGEREPGHDEPKKEHIPERRPRTPQAAAKPPKKGTAAPAPSSGRGVHFYVDDSDRRILNGLAVWFASQDRRMSDSQVIKASIRLAAAQQNAKLLDLADEVRAGDRRRNPKPDLKRPD